MFYARARINALKLEEHKGRGIEGYDRTCKLCGEEVEDLVHFVSKCKKLETVRDYEILDKNINNPEERMRKLLYRDERCWEIGKMLKDLWVRRRELLKELEKIKLPNKPKKNNGHNDSGSDMNKVQGSSGSGPQNPATQGCGNKRPRNIYLSKG